ncbi:hypothetical protein SAMN05421819_0162 [Bryocella elongata]|uniref:DUF4105 domain-containing protein n=1 Tax=Bryocella elongata TaxID=863522 RepID=A0A1H5SDY4_9BACT|nr:hypothetical protein SAMN05421819_0162 [Bryocella elongata]
MKVRTQAGRFRLGWWAVLAIAFGSAIPHSQASVAVLVEQPYGHLGTFSPGGHSAIFLDHVCAETPVKLRPCQPDELGVVISRYDGIQHLDWLAVPLTGYLYAVDTAADIPASMDREREVALRDIYRRAHLESIAPDLPDGKAPGGNWYELAGSAYDRAIFGFSVKTTAEQDAGLIALFNDRRNVERYNGAFTNCADFARVTINRFYPGAIHRNFIADFGVTSPKQVARQLTKYASRHPEVELEVFKVPQVRGSLPRSHANEGVSEALVRRYGLPIVLISPVTAALMLTAYIGDGRFEMPRHAPILDVGVLEAEARVLPALVAPAGGPEQEAMLTRSLRLPEPEAALPFPDPPSMPRVEVVAVPQGKTEPAGASQPF